MLQTLKRLWKDEDAPTAVEYGIMVALVAVVIIAAVRLLGQNVDATFATVNTQLNP
jgi:pilus assembly protein Flp/PilA